MSGGITKFRLILCINDTPGSLYNLLVTLKNRFRNNNTKTKGSNKSSSKSYYLNIKYITVETCERFARADSSIFDSPMNRLISLRPRARFHSIIELLKERNENSSNNDNNEEVVSVMEVTACLDKENTLESILQLLDLLQVKDLQVENEKLNVIIPNGPSKPINKYLSITYGNNKYTLPAIGKLLASQHQNCPKMGTCPLITSGKTKAQNEGNKKIIVRDITYIRDHGCYSKDYTLLELIGELEDEGEKKKGGNQQNPTEKNIPINAIVITVHYVSNETKNIVLRYLEQVQKNWKDLRSNSGDMLYYLDGNGENNDNDNEKFLKLYLMKWTHTCEYYPCYIVRSIKPVFILEQNDQHQGGNSKWQKTNK